MYKRVATFGMAALFVVYALSFVVLMRRYDPQWQENEQADTTLWSLSTVTATIDGVSQQIQLPYTFEGLDDRTEVVLTASFIPPEGDAVYIESTYTPVSVYCDGTLLYEYGQDGTFPAAMLDPALSAQILSLDSEGDSIEFTVVYLAPVTQDSFTVNVFYFGYQDALYNMVFDTAGFPFIFSILLVLLGLLLVVITLLVSTFERRAFPIVPLGCSILLAGLWLFCESNIATIFLGMPTRLFLISTYAMAIFPIGLMWFALDMLTLRHKRVLFGVACVEFLCTFVSIFLLLFGVVSSAIYINEAFHYIVPACIGMFSLYILYEYFIYRDDTLQRFVLPITIFALFSTLEFFNTRYAFAYIPVSFLEMGIILFILAVGILAGLFMRDALGMQAQHQQAAFEIQLMSYQAELLKKHSGLMMDTADSLKKQRHDLRHQLTVIQDLAQQDDTTALNEYLSGVMQQIPSAPMFYCSNATVNAILSHYAAVCERAQIDFTVDLNMPDQTEGFPDIDYCVIFGNLLENAVEACGYLPAQERVIRLSSSRRYHTLMIRMENSFDGQYKRSAGIYRSRKRNANGIGLTSVQSVAEKHGGDAHFKPDGTTFTCSIYMMIGTEHNNNEEPTC